MPNYQIQFRQDTSTNWAVNDPVLALGEPGWETDTGRLKIGDGVSVWTSLDYYFGSIGPVGPIGNIGSTGPIGITGNPDPIVASTGSNDFFGNQLINGGIRINNGFYLSKDEFTGQTTIPNGYNGSLIGPVDILGTITVEGSGVLAIL